MDQVKVSQVHEFLEGTCRTIAEVNQLFDLNEDDDKIQIELEADGLELCDICGWWCESYEMDLIDSVTNACDECREESENEYHD